MDTPFPGRATRYRFQIARLFGKAPTRAGRPPTCRGDDCKSDALNKVIALSAVVLGVLACWQFASPRIPLAAYVVSVAILILLGATLHFSGGDTRLRDTVRITIHKSHTAHAANTVHSVRRAVHPPWPRHDGFEVEDLLRRKYIDADAGAAREAVEDRVVLVTGAGGSIGSELCRQISRRAPRKLVLLDKSENGLFYAHLDCSEHLSAFRVKPLLADLLDRRRVEEIIRAERPEVIFHAAAHKHVGMLELCPREAMRNNVLGTRNIAEAALASGAGCFVNISTDKAVASSNYMGLSKKVTESLVRELARANGSGSTRFSNVRFGNVAGSTGSVLRLFRDRIRAGRPLSVTDPRATRYFMSVSEAVYLIFHAAAMGLRGETFVFDMGQPLNIYDLAREMIGQAGLRPGVDISIEFTGLRAGEKIDEELWETWEHPALTASERVMVIRSGDSAPSGVLAKIRKMEELLQRGDDDGLLRYVDEIFPAFRGRRIDGIPSVLPSEATGAEALVSAQTT